MQFHCKFYMDNGVLIEDILPIEDDLSENDIKDTVKTMYDLAKKCIGKEGTGNFYVGGTIVDARKLIGFQVFIESSITGTRLYSY